MDSIKEQAALKADCAILIESQHTLSLATVSADGSPHISYAPFVRDDKGRYCIFVSALSAHTGNLLRDPGAMVMLIRSEAEAANLFARERLTLRCQAQEVLRDEPDYETILHCMELRFGALIQTLRGLTDFHLLALVPQSGTYVVGFGRAYEVDPASGDLRHIDADRLKARARASADDKPD